MLCRWSIAIGGCFALLLALAADGMAQDGRSGQDVFPDDITVFVQVIEPTQLAEKLWAHPLRERIEELDAVRQAQRSPQWLGLMFIAALLERQLDGTWQEAIESAVSGGVWFGQDAESQAWALLAKSDDSRRLARTAGAILGAVQTLSAQAGNPAPYRTDTFRGHNVAVFEGMVVMRVDAWMIIASDEAFARRLATRLVEGAEDGLAASPAFREATEYRDREKPEDLWLWVDLERLREWQPYGPLHPPGPDQPIAQDPGLELLAGGLIEAAQRAPFLVAELNLKDDAIVVSAAVPSDPGDTHRQFFFGSDVTSQHAPPPIDLQGVIAQAGAHRDLSGWWLSKEDLFGESIVAQMALTDSQFSTLFGGLDFGSEILGALEPGLRIVVAEQAYDEAWVPEMKLPAFALVGRLKNPDVQPRLRIAFQSIVGFVNFQMGSDGYPQMELAVWRTEKASGISGEYLKEESGRGLVHFNFSPTVAFVGPMMIVSSTRELAEQLAAAPLDSAEPSQTHANTWLDIRGLTLVQLLQHNRELLVVNNMLEKGATREAAETEIDAVLEIAGWFETVTAQLLADHSSLRVEAEIRLR